MRVHRVGWPATALIAGAIAASGCARKQDTQAGVRTLIDDVRAAAEDRDAPAVVLRLSDDFHGTGGLNRTDATATLKQYFAAYEKVRVSVYDLAITPRSTQEADVTCRVELTGTVKPIGALAALLPPSAVYRFELHVVRPSGADWKVQSAEWQSAEGRPSP
jgi:hypothetical protein